METAAITSTPTTSAAANSELDKLKQETNPSKAESAEKKLSDDFDNFLLLLTTQLQNQDPTEPLDANQFTQQLVSFTGVEQQVATNQNLEKLLGFQNANQFSTAVGFVGKLVDAKGNAGELRDGQASFAYELPTDASTVAVVISDATGKAVFSGTGTTGEGKNLVVWDGVNTFTGRKMQDGTYFINVAARDTKGNTIESKTFTTGTVNGVETAKDGTIQLIVAGTPVKLENVLAVREQPRTVADAPAAPPVPANDNEDEGDETSDAGGSEPTEEEINEG